ncbi:MAG: GNAT family N-acetyltransferase [Bacilli bacterium]|nr:GNAT family N-acetyltransferase [Bacilli bacterium]
MIQELSINDKNNYYKLGIELNPNFMRAYNIDVVLQKEFEKIYGYYINNELIAFIHIQIMIDEADIVNIIVDKKYRRNGIATKLIDYVIKKYQFKALNLEVKENNPAINFYQNLGFKTLRIIPNYYSDGKDAKFMKKVI